MKHFGNFGEPLFTTLVAANMLFNKKMKYHMLFEYRFKDTQSDMIFIPYTTQDPIIINEHKITKVK
jgi:hypothetical protein